jgi:DNA-binding LacI/PurR family transcriptional regulator
MPLLAGGLDQTKRRHVNTMNESRKPVTLKDIARSAGVHFATVSLALRGCPGISAETCARIQKIARKLGYHPDPVLMALTSRRMNRNAPRPVRRMAFLSNHDGMRDLNHNPHMRYFYEGAREKAESLGYACDLVFVGGTHLSPRAVESRLRRTGCEGVIIGAFNLPFEGFILDWSRLAAVKIDSRFMDPQVDFVSNDQMQSVRLAYQRLRLLGYKRIGLAIGQYDEKATNRLYTAGYLIEQADLSSAELIPPLRFGYRDRVEDAVPKLRSWIRKHRVHVVLSNWSRILEMATEAGYRVPGDLACACLSLSDPDPELAGVIQDHRAVGRRAAELLALTLKTGRRGAPQHVTSTYLAGTWQDGPSAPPR